MCIGNLSYKEVNETYNFNNRFEALQSLDDTDFPLMNKTGEVKNNQEEINKLLRRHSTFSRVVQQKQIVIADPRSYPQADPMLDVGNQSMFSIQFEKTTDAEKFVSSMLKSFQQHYLQKLKQLKMQCNNY